MSARERMACVQIAAVLACAAACLGCSKCRRGSTRESPAARPTLDVAVDPGNAAGGASFLERPGHPIEIGGWAPGLRELVETGRPRPLAMVVGVSDRAGPCGEGAGVERCTSALTVALRDASLRSSMTVGASPSVRLGLDEALRPSATDAGSPPDPIRATSESVTGTIGIGPRLVGGADGIEDDGVDVTLDVTFRMSDGRDRHIVMTVRWRFVIECYHSSIGYIVVRRLVVDAAYGLAS